MQEPHCHGRPGHDKRDPDDRPRFVPQTRLTLRLSSLTLSLV